MYKEASIYEIRTKTRTNYLNKEVGGWELKHTRCCCFAVSLRSDGHTPGKRKSGPAITNDCGSGCNWPGRIM